MSASTTMDRTSSLMTVDVHALLHDEDDEEDEFDEDADADETDDDDDADDNANGHDNDSNSDTARTPLTAVSSPAAAIRNELSATERAAVQPSAITSADVANAIPSLSANPSVTLPPVATVATLFVVYMPRTNFKRFVISQHDVKMYARPADDKDVSISSPYAVSVSDISGALLSGGVTTVAPGIFVDVTDFGAHFISRTLTDLGKTASSLPNDDGERDDEHSGVWIDFANRTLIPAHSVAHPKLGNGYAVAVTLNLIERPQTMTTDALLINPPVPASLVVAAEISPVSAPPSSKSNASRTAGDSRRKVRPVESIGEMLDRIGEYQLIRATVKSKNKACAKLGYSKGTINAYREKVKAAMQAGIDLNRNRSVKYRDFKRLLLSVKHGKVLSTLDDEERGAVQRPSTSYGEVSVALMDAQDARARKKRNGRDNGDDELTTLNIVSPDNQSKFQRMENHESGNAFRPPPMLIPSGNAPPTLMSPWSHRPPIGSSPANQQDNVQFHMAHNPYLLQWHQPQMHRMPQINGASTMQPQQPTLFHQTSQPPSTSAALSKAATAPAASNTTAAATTTPNAVPPPMSMPMYAAYVPFMGPPPAYMQQYAMMPRY